MDVLVYIFNFKLMDQELSTDEELENEFETDSKSEA